MCTVLLYADNIQQRSNYECIVERGKIMLKGIPEILSPELLKVLCEMGHSDRLVIADGNFPVESMGKNAITIRCDGHGVPELLDAILQLFPLDTYVEKPVNLMEVMPVRYCRNTNLGYLQRNRSKT